MENYQATKFCSNCGAAMDASSAFCANCGAQQEVEQPQYQQPQYQQYQQPQYQQYQPQYNSYSVPEVSGKAKAFGIVGFATAMFGFIFGLINFFYCCSLIDTSWRYDDEKIACLIYAFTLIAFAIVGVAFSGSARNEGNESALTKLGKVFGIIAIITIGLTVFLMILELGGAF